jgi:hypothetical protein
MVLGTCLSKFNPEKVPLFVVQLSRGGYDSTKFNEKVISSKLLAYLPSELRYFTAVELKDPKPAQH